MLKELVSWEELAAHKGEVVCFGAGMVLSHIEQMLGSWGILDRIYCIVDNAPSKQGTEISYAGKTHRILSVGELGQMKLENPLLLITCEKDKEIIAGLEGNPLFEGWKLASYPKLNHQYRASLKASMPEAEEGDCIPKIIHTIWLGGRKMPQAHQDFIARWRSLCQDYDFMLWDESNYDIRKCAYTKEAYEAGDYAHVSDYVRMDILYQYGGFYMDTDVELLKGLDGLRKHGAVFTYGEWPVVNSGVLCGAVPGHEIIRRIRDLPRAKAHYYDEAGRPDKRTNCYYENEIFKAAGFQGDFTSQSINGVAVYSPVYFASEGAYFGSYDVTAETIAVHHCFGSWKRR